MADLTASAMTSLQPEDVILRAVQFFTNARWRAQSQSSRVVTFVGRPPIPFGMLFLTFLGFLFFIIPGIILYFAAVRKMIQFQNIVVTANQSGRATEVIVTHPKYVQENVERFMSALPAGGVAQAMGA